MNKVISFAAILALSAASEEFGDNDLNILKTIGHDLKKAGEFVVQHPKIITTAAKFLDDEAVVLHKPIYRIPEHPILFSDEELNILTTIKNDAKKAGHYIAEHPELITKAAEVYKTLHKDDDVENELNIFKKIGDGLKKAGKFVVSHPQIITTAAKFLDDEAAENELNVWTTIKNDAKKVGHFVADHPQVITEAANVYKTLKHDDEADDEFAINETLDKMVRGLKVLTHRHDDQADDELNVWTTIKKDAKKVGHFVADHPQVITEAAKAYKTLKHDDVADDELNVWTTIKNDAKKVGHFVAEHPQIIKTAAKFLDEEADDELNIFKTIGHDLKKAGEFVVQHPKIITTAAKFLDDEADDELNVWTTIKNDAKKVGHFVADHPQVITEAAKVIKTLKHDDQADDELNVWTTIKNDAKKVGHFVADHPQVITEAAKVIKTLKHDDQADDELNILKTIGHDLKKAGEFVVQHPKIITTAAKFLDDEQMVRINPRTFHDHLPVVPHFQNADDDELFAHERVEQRVHEGVKKAQRDVRVATEALKKYHNEKRASNHHDSLSNLGELLHEGQRIHRAHKNSTKAAAEVHDNMNFLEDFQDNNLSIKDKLKGAANWIGDHPQVITEGAKTYKILKGKH